MMASAAATASASISASVVPVGKPPRRKQNVVYLKGMGPFQGLKRYNRVSSIGVRACADQAFAQVAHSLRSSSQRRTALFTCNAAGEIFKIAGVMNGLVLVGVAVGFVLLRIEAWLEETEAE